MHNAAQQRWWPSLVLGLVLTMGACAVWLVACWFAATGWEAVDNSRHWERLQVRDNAVVFVEEYFQENRQARTSYRTIEGQPAQGFEGKAAVGVSLNAVPKDSDRGALTWQNRIWGFNDGNNHTNRWYLIHDGRPEGTAYFVGYNALNKRIIGYLGVQGSAGNIPPPAERFLVNAELLSTRSAFAGRTASIGCVPSVTGWDLPLYLLADGSVYQIDLLSRKVTRLQLDEKVVSIGTTTEERHGENDGVPFTTTHNRPVFRTESAIVFPLVPDAGLEPRGPLPIPVELRNDDLTYYACRGSENILVREHFGNPALSEVFWVDSAGKINRRADVQLASLNGPIDSATHWWTALFVPSSALMLLVECTLLPLGNQSLDYATNLQNTLAIGWPPLLTVFLLGAALSAWVYRRERRFAAPGAALWSIVVFLFGPFGLAGYWLHRNWPTRERCPNCGQMVPRDRACCAACAAHFPSPALLGIEIFA